MHVEQTVQVAKEEKVDLYLFLGDLTDPEPVRSHLSTAFVASVAQRLASADIMSRWLVGNHDVIEDGHGVSTLGAIKAAGPWRQKAEMVRVYSAPTLEDFDHNVSLLALPFTPRSHTYDPAEVVKAFAKDIDPAAHVIVAGHLNIAGIEPGSETEDMPRGRDVMFPLAACKELFKAERSTLFNGHYHRAQLFEGIHIPGSLDRLTFGEAKNEPGFLVVEVFA
jgi:DNA repair exonuclease SbcCD nuclease subunit